MWVTVPSLPRGEFHICFDPSQLWVSMVRWGPRRDSVSALLPISMCLFYLSSWRQYSCSCQILFRWKLFHMQLYICCLCGKSELRVFVCCHLQPNLTGPLTFNSFPFLCVKGKIAAWYSRASALLFHLRSCYFPLYLFIFKESRTKCYSQIDSVSLSIIRLCLVLLFHGNHPASCSEYTYPLVKI